MEYIDEWEYQQITILSDSLSVLQTIRNSHATNHLSINSSIAGIKIIVNKLKKRGRFVKFVWVKAHTGLEHNEEVDIVAKKSILEGENLRNGLHIEECISLLEKKNKEEWSTLWREYSITKPTRYTFIQPDIPKNFWHKDLKYSRKEITTVCRLKFGHGCYPAHLKKIGVLETDLCDVCNVAADLDHIFFECSKYQAESELLHKKLIDLKTSLPYNLCFLLAENKKSIYDVILEFLKNVKLDI